MLGPEVPSSHSSHEAATPGRRHPHTHKKAAPEGEIRSRVNVGRIARPSTRFGGQTC